MDVNNEELFVEILIIEEILMWSFFPKHIFFVDGIEYDYLETTGTVYCQFIVGLKTQRFGSYLKSWSYQPHMVADMDWWLAEGKVRLLVAGEKNGNCS